MTMFWGAGLGALKVTTYIYEIPCDDPKETVKGILPAHFSAQRTLDLHKFGGCCCGLQNEKERRLAHLVGFGLPSCKHGELPALNQGGNGTRDYSQTRLQDRSGHSCMKSSGTFIKLLGGSF